MTLHRDLLGVVAGFLSRDVDRVSMSLAWRSLAPMRERWCQDALERTRRSWIQIQPRWWLAHDAFGAELAATGSKGRAVAATIHAFELDRRAWCHALASLDNSVLGLALLCGWERGRDVHPPTAVNVLWHFRLRFDVARLPHPGAGRPFVLRPCADDNPEMHAAFFALDNRVLGLALLTSATTHAHPSDMWDVFFPCAIATMLRFVRPYARRCIAAAPSRARICRDALSVVASFLPNADKAKLLRVWPAEVTSLQRLAWIKDEIAQIEHQWHHGYHPAFISECAIGGIKSRNLTHSLMGHYIAPAVWPVFTDLGDAAAELRQQCDTVGRMWSPRLVELDNAQLGLELLYNGSVPVACARCAKAGGGGARFCRP